MNKIRKARRVMRDAFAEDPGFRRGYQGNIAMAIYDHLYAFGFIDLSNQNAYIDDCKKTADSIIKLIFESGFDDEEDKPTRPTPEFIDGLTFDTIEVAQTVLDAEYPGYTIEADNGLHIVYDPNHVSYAAIQATRVAKTCQGEKFEGYDHALKDLVE